MANLVYLLFYYFLVGSSFVIKIANISCFEFFFLLISVRYLRMTFTTLSSNAPVGFFFLSFFFIFCFFFFLFFCGEMGGLMGFLFVLFFGEFF